METKFTPGPWRVEKRHAVHSSKRRTANANVMNHRIPYMERKANAHLIAAAPEMYALLEAIMLYKLSFDETSGVGEMAEVFGRAIFSVLKKARGETN